MNTNAQKKLILQVEPQKIAYIIQNRITNEVLHFNQYTIDPYREIDNELDKMMSQDELLQTDFEEVELLHNNTLNTIVPNEFYKEEALGNYLQFTIKVFPTDYFASDEISPLQAHNVYVPYVNFNNYFLDKFGAFEYKHIYTPLLEYTFAHSMKDVQKFWLYKAQNSCVIIIYKQQHLAFINAFEIESKEDLLYYILFVMEQMQIDPSQQVIHAIGDLEEKDNYYELLFDYIKTIELPNYDILAKQFNCSKEILKNYYTLLHT